MNRDSDLLGTRPLSIWKRPVEVKFAPLATALGKAVAAAAADNWPIVMMSFADSIKALGLKSQDAGAIAWLLISSSLLQAMSNLVEDYLKSKAGPAPNFQQLGEQLDWALKENTLMLTSDFFERPKSLEILTQVETPYRRWLQTCEIPEQEATAIAQRLPSYFVFALNEQWRANPDTYGVLKEQLDTPFTNATQEEQGQQRYNAWLQKQIEEPLFAEAFGP